MTDVAVVGLGAYGLCALERLVAAARAGTFGAARIHVVDPGVPGSGVFAVDEPDYLLLNTPCSQLSLSPWPEDGKAGGYGLSLHEWVKRRGYRWVGDACRVTDDGREITEHDFLPRRLLGEYLQWCYGALVAGAPASVDIVHHRTIAVDIVPAAGDRETVVLPNEQSITVDHVILASGHTENIGHPSRFAYPYDRLAHDATVRAGASVGVAGMGLTAVDVVAALTTGRGGSFVDRGNRLRYVPSGREPVICLFSRGGLPYCAKPPGVSDETDDYSLVICTAEAVAALRRGGRQIDARTELLPLVLAEMQVRYYAQSAHLDQGPGVSSALRDRLAEAWARGQFDDALETLAARYGRFDPARHLLVTSDNGFASAKDYEANVYASVEADLDEAVKPDGSSPLKSAYEVLRFVRDPMRNAIEFGGLTLGSYLDFRSNIRSRITRLVAGPPALRSKQLLALMDAGVVRVPFGPDPKVGVGDGSGARISSRHLDTGHSEPMDAMIQGFLEDPTVHRSASPLLSRLHAAGRLQQMRYGDTPVGSVALSEDFHPINASGEVERRISLFGALTEGVRYFTHYLPSPKSRLRAFRDAQACVDQIAASQPAGRP